MFGGNVSYLWSEFHIIMFGILEIWRYFTTTSPFPFPLLINTSRGEPKLIEHIILTFYDFVFLSKFKFLWKQGTQYSIPADLRSGLIPAELHKSPEAANNKRKDLVKIMHSEATMCLLIPIALISGLSDKLNIIQVRSQIWNEEVSSEQGSDPLISTKLEV